MSTKTRTVEQNGIAKETPARNRTHSAHTREGSPDLFGFSEAQESAGNLAVQQLLRSRSIQAKLSISQPNDPDEQEADQVAGRVMRMPESASTGPCQTCATGNGVCPKCAEQTPRQIRRKAEGSGASQAPSFAPHLIRNFGPGHALGESARAFLEPRMGADLSHIRVHTNASAAE